eukprot:554650-Prorocentrum_minimum.AAC.1
MLRAPQWMLRAPQWMLRVPQWMLRARRTVFVFGAYFTASAKEPGGELRNSPVVERLNKGLLS